MRFKLNDLLIFIIIITVIICALIMFFQPKGVHKEYVLVQDSLGSNRYIDDKTVLHDKNEDITIKGEKDDSYINPDDYFKEEEKPSDDKPTIPSEEQNPVRPSGGNKKDGVGYIEPGTVITVIEDIEMPVEERETNDIDYWIFLNDAKEARNPNKELFDVGSAIFNFNDTIINGCIVVFVTNTETDYQFLNKILPYYNANKDRIPFVFMSDNVLSDEFYTFFDDNGMSYYLDFNMYILSTYGYYSNDIHLMVVNCDSYVDYSYNSNSALDMLEQNISYVQLECLQFRAENEKLYNEYYGIDVEDEEESE